MQKGRFSEMPIIGMLSEQKAKIMIAQVRRRRRLN